MTRRQQARQATPRVGTRAASAARYSPPVASRRAVQRSSAKKAHQASWTQHTPACKWALDNLVWSTEHFDGVISVYARLASLDPGGTWGNRPAEGLAAVFCPWHPDTFVDSASEGTSSNREPVSSSSRSTVSARGSFAPRLVRAHRRARRSGPLSEFSCDNAAAPPSLGNEGGRGEPLTCQIRYSIRAPHISGQPLGSTPCALSDNMME